MLYYFQNLDNTESVHQSICFQNKEIFIELDQLDKLDRIIHAWIGFNSSHRKYSSVMVRVADS